MERAKKKKKNFGNKDLHEKRLREMHPEKRQVQRDTQYMSTKMQNAIMKT